MKVSLLIVEDDEGVRTSLEKSFARKGHRVQGVATVAAAVEFLRTRKVDLVLLDFRLPDGSGFDVLKVARELDDDILVVVMTAYPQIETAVQAIKSGAHDFIVKPFELEDMHLTVERAVEAIELRRRVHQLEHEQQRRGTLVELVGKCPAMVALYGQIEKVAGSDVAVLILGETGTGKELVANSVHRLSTRSAGPLIKVNCSTFSEQLLESELFGHEKGAFTDAKSTRAGLFEMADGGTLFLDEIAEMKPGLQAKLLRVIEGHAFRRVGGQREIAVDVRVVAATNKRLPLLIARGEFREDLYFRLNVFRIELPPLRARGGDVIELAELFLGKLGGARGTKKLMPATQTYLGAYDWPGNVRELRGVIERAALLCEDDKIDVVDLPPEVQAASFVRQSISRTDVAPTLRQIERRYIAHVLNQVDGNVSEAARILGIARNTLKAKLRSSADEASHAGQ